VVVLYPPALGAQREQQLGVRQRLGERGVQQHLRLVVGAEGLARDHDVGRDVNRGRLDVKALGGVVGELVHAR